MSDRVGDREGSPTRVGDVIQIDPDGGCDFGPLLAIVDELRPAWNGVIAEVMIPGSRGECPGLAPFRVPGSKFVRIGPAAWIIAPAGEKNDEKASQEEVASKEGCQEESSGDTTKNA